MNKSAKKNLIWKTLKPFAEKNGFKLDKSLVLIREKDSILQVINFDLPSSGFNCDIAIQPLYFPADGINLSLGTRLNNLDPNNKGIWGYGDSEEELLKDLDEVISLLQFEAMAWFELLDTPHKVISFIENDLSGNNSNRIVLWFPPFLKYMYLALSYMHIKKYEKSKLPLENLYNILKDDKREGWVTETKELTLKLISLVKQDKKEEIDIEINKYIAFTKESISNKY